MLISSSSKHHWRARLDKITWVGTGYHVQNNLHLPWVTFSKSWKSVAPDARVSPHKKNLGQPTETRKNFFKCILSINSYENTLHQPLAYPVQKLSVHFCLSKTQAITGRGVKRSLRGAQVRARTHTESSRNCIHRTAPQLHTENFLSPTLHKVFTGLLLISIWTSKNH